MSVLYAIGSRASRVSTTGFVLILLLTANAPIFADPYLQLDANPAIYVGPPEESVVTTSSVFTLYTLVNSDKGGIAGDFFLSMAVLPSLQPEPSSPPDLGSFTFDGATIHVTADMEYGTPPSNLFTNPGLLGPHDVFDTYFFEHSFTLAGASRTNSYNVQDFPGGPGADVPDGILYYQEFDINATGLLPGYFLHFDLYTKVGDQIDKFAPFSHDVTHAPVPGAFLLGILGLGVAGVKMRKLA